MTDITYDIKKRKERSVTNAWVHICYICAHSPLDKPVLKKDKVPFNIREVAFASEKDPVSVENFLEHLVTDFMDTQLCITSKEIRHTDRYVSKLNYLKKAIKWGIIKQ